MSNFRNHAVNNPQFCYDGRPRRFGKIQSVNRSNQLNQAVDTNKRAFVTEVFEPKNDWRPFKLINERLGVAHTILEPMTYAKIVREVLGDNTPSSNLAKVIRGECKRANGWRCEHL